MVRRTRPFYFSCLISAAAAVSVLISEAACGAPAGATSRNIVSATAAATSHRSWPSGVFVNNPLSGAGLKQFGTYRNRPIAVGVTYADRSSWSAMDNPWLLQQYAGFRGRLSIGLPLTLRRALLPAVAQGKYDQYFAAFAKLLNSSGRANSIVRLGWEFNGTWYAWSAFDPATYKAAFRHVVTVLRKQDPSVLIDWDGNLGTSQCGHNPFTTLYPGNRYVDIVGVDTFDLKWSKISSLKAFASWTNRPFGLNSWYRFATQHKKPLSVPEWGVITNKTSSDIGEGDNPVYVRGMYSWFAAHASKLAYEAYFNNPYEPRAANSLEGPVQMRKSAAMYKSLWAQH